MTQAAHALTPRHYTNGGAPPLAICYGTRPQVIKASMLVAALERHWRVLTVDTGQHYDYELNALLYEQLGVRAPDVLLGVGSGSHADQTSAILLGASRVLQEHSPWAVVVIGDTNSTLGCALAAAKMRIPVIHVEAGLRAADALMAEEINRRTVDAISSVLCAPSEAAEQRLRAERSDGTIAFTGDVARDVLVRQADRLASPPTLAGWPVADGAPYAFATLHRAELTSDPAMLRSVLLSLGRLPVPVVLATHPRTRAVMIEHDLLRDLGARVFVQPPFGYLETLACVKAAAIVITDSGGVQREAYWLGTPCVTLRAETEWHETVALEANTLVPGSQCAERLPTIVDDRLNGHAKRGWNRDAYGQGDAADRIVDAIATLQRV